MVKPEDLSSTQVMPTTQDNMKQSKSLRNGPSKAKKSMVTEASLMTEHGVQDEMDIEDVELLGEMRGKFCAILLQLYEHSLEEG